MLYEVMVGKKAATGVKLARIQVASAFPITPQTTITQYLSEMYAAGEWEFDFVNVEGELTSQVVIQGASRTGARTFTCTSGPGLLYMHHPMHRTGASRLPVVMENVHRNTKGMQPDHSDLMAQQWAGWIYWYVEHDQEILDPVLMAYKVAEGERVRLPRAFGYDRYMPSYTAKPVEVPDQEAVDNWLPPNRAITSIIPDEVDPETFGRRWGGGDPQMSWKIHHEAILRARASRSHTSRARKFLGGSGKLVEVVRKQTGIDEIPFDFEAEMVEQRRVEAPLLTPENRVLGFREVEQGYTFNYVIEEAKRCLRCDRKPME